MAYTQPNPLVDGTVLNSEHLKANEDSAMVFINQEMVTADMQLRSLSTEDIARGETFFFQNGGKFQSSQAFGTTELSDIPKRAWCTSTTKNNIQTTGIEYQDIYNSSQTVTLAQRGFIVITCYLKLSVNNNSNVPTNKGPGPGMWQNTFYLREITERKVLRFTTTDNYCFEGVGSPLDTKSPGADSYPANQRSIMITYRLDRQPGTYTFTHSVNPHNEAGFASARSMSVEVFYI